MSSIWRKTLGIFSKHEIDMWCDYIQQCKKCKRLNYGATKGRSQTFQNEGVARGLRGGWLWLKIAALHRPLYKVSFHLGGSRGLGFWLGCSSPQTPFWLHLWCNIKNSNQTVSIANESKYLSGIPDSSKKSHSFSSILTFRFPIILFTTLNSALFASLSSWRFIVFQIHRLLFLLSYFRGFSWLLGFSLA